MLPKSKFPPLSLVFSINPLLHILQ